MPISVSHWMEHATVPCSQLRFCAFSYRIFPSVRIGKANGVWRAPEEYSLEWLDEKIDIYSLGIVFWVMMTRQLPDDQHESSDQWKTVSNNI